MKYEELRRFYSEHFSLGYLNIPNNKNYNSFEQKLILISLICYIVEKNKPKNPDMSPYYLLYKLNEKLGLPDNFIKGLAIVCEDFSYNEHSFPTFGFEGKQILDKVVSILKTYVPF
jgi:hypothetical protein